MIIIKSETIKEAVDNVKREQNEKGLNDIERLKDWEKRYILRSEQLEEAKKDLEKKTSEAQFWKEYKENVKWQTYEILLAKEREEVKVLKKILDEKNESIQISLLKEKYEKEIRELKKNKEIIEENCDGFNKEGLEDKGKIKKLEKGLEKIKVFEEIVFENKDIKDHFSLLSELYKDEVKELEEDLNKLNKQKSKGLGKVEDKIEETKKELEEKESLIKKLEDELKEQNNQLTTTQVQIEVVKK